MTVARQLREARGSDWQRQFTPEKLLTANQIQGFFSRRAKSKNQADVEAEDTIASVRNEATNQTQLIHPVSFDDYNVILLLEEGCASLKCPFYETFVVTLISSKSQHLPHRKAPYEEILEKHVRACSCSGTLLGDHLSFVV